MATARRSGTLTALFALPEKEDIMADVCDWCNKPISGSNEKYNGIWHYKSVYLDGHYICIDCLDRYTKTVENFSINLRKNKGKFLDEKISL